jgi:hypothetical protein
LFERRQYSVDDYDAEIDRIVDFAFNKKTPDVLHHYTSLENARNILRSQVLWASRHDSMRDLVEIDSAGDVIRDVGRELLPRERGMPREVLRLFLEYYDNWKARTVFDSFLVCLSSARDKASQWRDYADRGRGVCLGIKVIRGEKPPPDEPPIRGRGIFEVDYCPESWRDRVLVAFTKICSRLRRFESLPDGEPRARAFEWAGVGLSRIAATAETVAKRPKYASEEEWRIVAIALQGSEVPTSPRGKPYVPLRLRAERLRIVFEEIMIGPEADTEAARRAIEEMLTEAGYPDASAPLPRITYSVCPRGETEMNAQVPGSAP